MTRTEECKGTRLNEHTETAVKLWEALTGIKVNSQSFTGSLGQSFSLYKANQKIQMAQELNDSSAVTLVIRNLFSGYAKNCTFEFTLAELLRMSNEDIDTRVTPARTLQAFLDTEAIRVSHEAFFADCVDAMRHYRGQSSHEVQASTREYVEQYSGLVGLDAYNDLKRLTRLTMFEGDPADDPNPKVNHLIFAFETLEELMAHGASIPSGFSLCAITSKHISDSYFVLIVRNGERVIILTDRENYSHPLQQERMRSRNDRYNLSRIENSRFPYELLNIVWGDNGRSARPSETGRELMSSETGFRVLGTINELGNHDLLWLHLLIQQCQQRYFIDGVTEPGMATGSMIRLTHPWLTHDQLPVKESQQFSIDTRTSSELSTSFMHSIEPAWENDVNPNLWMEDRFAAKVPDQCLYIPEPALAEESVVPVITSDSDAINVSLVDTAELSWLERRELTKPLLAPISHFSLNTREEIIRDVHFLARQNQSTIIKHLVARDYKERHREVIDWFNKAVANHLPTFLDDLLALNHAAFCVVPKSFDAMVSGLIRRRASSGFRTEVRSRIRQVEVSYEPTARQQYFCRESIEQEPDIRHLLELVDYYDGHHLCYLDEEVPGQIFLGLAVSNVADIMRLTGLPLDQIPVELHTRGIDVYIGNSILDRVDPLATLSNPWDKLPLKFCLPVSVKKFKAWRKARGLETPKVSEIQEWAKRHAREYLQSIAKDQNRESEE